MKGWVGPGMNTKVEQQSHHDCLGCEVNGVTLILIECELIIIFSTIVIIDRFLLLFIIVNAGWYHLTQLGVLVCGIGAHGKVFHAVAANKSQVVMVSLYVVYHYTLVLSFSTPWTEGQPTLPLQGLGVMDPPQAHDFWVIQWAAQP